MGRIISEVESRDKLYSRYFGLVINDFKRALLGCQKYIGPGSKSILSIGPGGTYELFLLKSMFPDSRVLGLDNSSSVSKVCEGEFEFLKQDMCEPIVCKKAANGKGRFDLIVLKSSFCYAKDKERLIRNLKGVLTENGCILVYEPNRSNLFVKAYFKLGIFRLFFSESVEENGFLSLKFYNLLLDGNEFDKLLSLNGFSVRKSLLGLFQLGVYFKHEF